MRIVVLIALAASIAKADPRAADTAATEAQALAANGQFGAAAAKFRDAYRAEPRPELMCNVGVAYYKAHDLPRAQRYLDQCVQVGNSVDPAFIATVKQVLASLDASLRAGDFTPVDFLVEPTTASIAAVGNEPFDEPIVGSRRVWFPFGSFRVVIHAEGYVDQTIAISAAAHDAIARPVTLERAPAHEPVVSRTVYVQPPERSLKKPVAATVVAGVVGASAAAFYGFARIRAGDANAADTAGDRPTYDAASHAARSWQVAAIGAAVIAAATAGAAVYFWTHRIEIEPVARGGTVSLAGRF